MNWLKNLLRIPALIASALTFFISYVFLFTFLPFKYPEGQLSNPWCFITIVLFCYFSTMTQVFLWMTLLSDPGYLPDKLKRDRLPNGHAPLREVRLY